MGYAAQLKIHVYDDIFAAIQALKLLGYRVFAAEAAPGATPLVSLKVPDRWVLIMGHEGLGISPEVLNACDETVAIEMAEGVKSFNVGVAASILMYGFQNRR
jgi:tRNA G18 (ribose-2'-O)-methylase SpoU